MRLVLYYIFYKKYQKKLEMGKQINDFALRQRIITLSSSTNDFIYAFLLFYFSKKKESAKDTTSICKVKKISSVVDYSFS